MFNYRKINTLKYDKIELESRVRNEASRRKRAEDDATRLRDEVDRLRGFISLVADRLVPKRYRQTFGIPECSRDCATAESPNQSGQSPETKIRNHIKELEREEKEFAERQKIEQIVLDLKNRKWEPLE